MKDFMKILARGMLRLLLAFATFLLSISPQASAQQKLLRPLDSGVPFLLINPDARTAAMGDAGTALFFDNNPTATNPAKIGLKEVKFGVSISYSPWLQSLADDIDIAYAGAYYKLNDSQAISSALRYFSMGKFELSDGEQQSLGEYNPNELAFDASYIKAFGEEFAMSLTLRYIHSAVQSSGIIRGNQAGSGNAFSSDLHIYYTRQMESLHGGRLSFSAAATNIGPKFDYGAGDRQFLPANFMLGSAFEYKVDDLNAISFAIDISKLMVPTPVDLMEGQALRSANQSVTSAILGSWTDAPGGFSEEIREVIFALGTEYKYSDRFSLRSGYFYENPGKGNRRYATAGLGFQFGKLGIDMAYIIADPLKTPLANTLRFSMAFGLR